MLNARLVGLVVLGATAAGQAMAEVAPAGPSMVGAVWTLLVVTIAAVVFLFAWPVKGLFGRRPDESGPPERPMPRIKRRAPERPILRGNP